MNALANHIATNNLVNDSTKMTAYNSIANHLYRTKDNNKSALCYAYYMHKRRSHVQNGWWNDVLSKDGGSNSLVESSIAVNANNAITTSMQGVKTAVVAVQQARVDADPFDQSSQRKATREFLKAAFNAIGALYADQNTFNPNSAYKAIDGKHIYVQLVSNMEQYRWGLSNLAIYN